MQPTLTHPQALEKSLYKEEVDRLRIALLKQQRRISELKTSVIIVIAGDDRAGRHDLINTLMTWLDARFIKLNAYGPAEQLTQEHPFLWRYWQDLPAHGQLAIYFRDWTSSTIVQSLNGALHKSLLSRRLQDINDYEKSLFDNGSVIVKFWLHLSYEAHENKRQNTSNADDYDRKDELAYEHYDTAMASIDQILSATHTESTPWSIVDSDHPLKRNILVGRHLLTCLQQVSDNETETDIRPWSTSTEQTPNRLQRALAEKSVLSKAEYQHQFKTYSTELRQLAERALRAKHSVICVFEGVDAAGKGGAIRRLVSALDVDQYRIVPIVKPNDDAIARHYLWRFWRHIPADGLMTIFDRSWYGRVLVERVEKFAANAQWQRAYTEINQFEKQLTDYGILVVKFWLHIDQDEQLRRFQAREITPHKQHKITDEDYRNRKQWPAYEQAIEDMLKLTDTEHCHWHVIPAQDKRFARIAVFETLITAIKHHLQSTTFTTSTRSSNETE